MPKVFYEISTLKLAFNRHNLAFKTLAFSVMKLTPEAGFLSLDQVKSQKSE